MAAANCAFTVIRKSGQLSPITSEKRALRMVGRGEVIPSIDEAQYGIPARLFLQKYPNSFVLVIDDLEGARREQVRAVFTRYRLALNQMLDPYGLADRASVHFLVNMLEAYYFAHAGAVNTVAGTDILDQDHPDDVESIRHPKNQLRDIWQGFDEVEHGSLVLDELDLHHVLQHDERCCWLRTMFYWCIIRINAGSVWDSELTQSFRLPDGCRIALTENQQIV
jgi:hypothetical protein